MKPFLLTGLLLLAMGQTAVHAQNRGTYKDDIYYTADDAKKDAEQNAKENEEKRASDNSRTYSSSDGDYTTSDDGRTYNHSYESDGDAYIDYDDDDYYYSTRFRRFGSYYGYGYYTPFYDPFWGPAYSPWYSPGVTVSIGWGGPYWSNYYGWNYWYGYPGFYSAWNYPYYGYGSYYNGYYNGFYDGYYSAGGGYGRYRTVNYGPRNSFHNTSYNASNTGLRRPASTGYRTTTAPNPVSNGPRAVLRPSGTDDNRRVIANTPIDNSSPMRGGSAADRGTLSTERYSNSAANEVRMDNNMSSAPAQQSAPQASPRRNGFFQRIMTPDNNSAGNMGGNRSMDNNQTYQQPVQREQPSYRQAAPSYERRSTPTYSSPSRGSSGGGFSSGGRRR